MNKMQISHFLFGVILALALAEQGFAQSPGRQPSEACESTTLKAKTNSLIDAEIVTRSEQRVEALRARQFELEAQVMDLQAHLDNLDYRLTPEGIYRALAFVGSARPMDELRDALRIRLETQRARVSKQLERLISNGDRLDAAVREAEAELERVRQSTAPVQE